MSQFTNYAENKLADFFRGQGLTLPPTWYVALGSAASDTSFTELSGTGYARQPVSRMLTTWAGTQGAGTTLASTGTSHSTSNNNAISWGNPAAAWGTASAVGLFDALSGGNCWIWVSISSITITIGSPNPVQLAIGALPFSLGLAAGGCSDYLANKLIDRIFRGQVYDFPSPIYHALYTVAPTSAGGGTEVSGGSYARASLTPSLTSISGTQGVGTTAASSGTAGRISNNAPIVFATPSASWGAVVATGINDAASAGNLLFSTNLTTPRTISATSPAPTFLADALGITLA